MVPAGLASFWHDGVDASGLARVRRMEFRRDCILDEDWQAIYLSWDNKPNHINLTMTLEEASAALHRSRLYGILDTGYSHPEDWPELARQFVEGGAGIIQIRAKNHEPGDILRWARQAVDILHPLGCPVIINDYPELVTPAGAAGVHVGQDDYPVDEARRLAGKPCLVGKSTHSLDQARQAEQGGADYIGFGPIYATPTKPGRPPIGKEAIQAMSQSIRIPSFCIGGIKAENLSELTSLGARRVVIVSGLLTAHDPAAYARKVLEDLLLTSD